MPENESLRDYVSAGVEDYAGDHGFRPLWCGDCGELVGWATLGGEVLCTTCLRSEAGE